MKREINFTATAKDRALIGKIVDRATGYYKAAKVKVPATDTEMDVTATHLNGCRLNLAGLAAADQFNLMHDITGIRHNLNRTTGKLENCFLPRFRQRYTMHRKKDILATIANDGKPLGAAKRRMGKFIKKIGGGHVK